MKLDGRQPMVFIFAGIFAAVIGAAVVAEMDAPTQDRLEWDRDVGANVIAGVARWEAER